MKLGPVLRKLQVDERLLVEAIREQQRQAAYHAHVAVALSDTLVRLRDRRRELVDSRAHYDT